ncbi:DUF86 domain-containing protein [Ramlibacter sp.]|uniref:type VII toxin-antitoxin system HepT family RNase toxin n=1 Tax=Ramlibacter sp. TaxID=1917967 RepID=UPI0035AEC9B6
MNRSVLRDALAQKADRITRCIARARAERAAATNFACDLTHQDAAILNVQRACELAIDMANMVVAEKQWGLPASARESFALLHSNGWIDADLAGSLGRMVGFRNVAVHAYDDLDLSIAEAVIDSDIDCLSRLASILLDRTA